MDKKNEKERLVKEGQIHINVQKIVAHRLDSDLLDRLITYLVLSVYKDYYADEIRTKCIWGKRGVDILMHKSQTDIQQS